MDNNDRAWIISTGRALLTLGLLLCSHSALALELGEAQLLSTLGEPLSVQIPIRNTKVSADQLIVQQADAATYQQMNIERSPHFYNLQFRQRSDSLITITTREPVKEPFLSFVIQLRWPEGNLNKTIDLLLDPS